MNKSAEKRDRQNLKRRAHNRVIKSKVHTALKKLLFEINAKNNEAVPALYKKFESEIDKAVKRGIYHRNKGARKKSRLTKVIKTLLNKAA